MPDTNGTAGSDVGFGLPSPTPDTAFLTPLFRTFSTHSSPQRIAAAASDYRSSRTLCRNTQACCGSEAAPKLDEAAQFSLCSCRSSSFIVVAGFFGKKQQRSNRGRGCSGHQAFRGTM